VVDFDPDPSVSYFLTAQSSSDVFILKLDAASLAVLLQPPLQRLLQ